MDKRPTFIIISTETQNGSEDEYRGLTEQELDEIFRKDNADNGEESSNV